MLGPPPGTYIGTSSRAAAQPGSSKTVNNAFTDSPQGPCGRGPDWGIQKMAPPKGPCGRGPHWGIQQMDPPQGPSGRGAHWEIQNMDPPKALLVGGTTGGSKKWMRAAEMSSK